MFKKILFGVSLTTILSSQALAGGFMIYEQGEMDLGNNHSGSAANALDATIQYSNPAGMFLLSDRPQISTGLAAILPNIHFNGTVTGSGDRSENYSAASGGSNFIFVPNINYVQTINDNWRVGFGINSIYNTATDYNSKDELLGNVANFSSVKSVEFGPSLAYKVNDKLSLGLGVNLVYSWAQFDQNGSLSLFGPPITASSVNNLDAFGINARVGALYQYSKHTRFGITYFVPTSLNYKGTSRTTSPSLSPGPNLPPGSPFKKEPKSHIMLPQRLVFSAFHNIGIFDLMASVTWVDWSAIQNVTLDPVALPIPNGNHDKYVLPLNFKDGMNYSFGTNIHVTDKFMLQFGSGWDMTPVPNPSSRTLELPDSDRWYVTTGMNYQATDHLKMGLGMLYAFGGKVNINQNNASVYSNANANGTSKGGAFIFAGQLAYTF